MSVLCPSPPLPALQAATGETISSEELGGAWVHCSVSGCVDHFGSSEEEGLQRVREVVGNTSQPGATAERSGGDEPGQGGGASLEDFARLLPAPEDVADCGNFPMLEVRTATFMHACSAVLCCDVM